MENIVIKLTEEMGRDAPKRLCFSLDIFSKCTRPSLKIMGSRGGTLTTQSVASATLGITTPHLINKVADGARVPTGNVAGLPCAVSTPYKGTK